MYVSQFTYSYIHVALLPNLGLGVMRVDEMERSFQIVQSTIINE